jgi:hypothetical protein
MQAGSGADCGFAIRKDLQYESTDPDFGGVVRVTSVDSERVYYEGDADGYASLAEFAGAYRPLSSESARERGL